MPLLAPLADDDETGDVPSVEIDTAGWRTEVLARGRYWQWRKGRNGNRVGKYGGRFADLPEDRQHEYQRNKRKRAHRK